MLSHEGLVVAPASHRRPASWSERRRLVPSALAALRLDALARDLNGYLGGPGPNPIEWAAMLTARAGLVDLLPPGRTSANGSCRLCRTLDGWVAINLARADDRAVVSALVGHPVGEDPWPEIEDHAAVRETAPLLAEARLLGLPAAPLNIPPPGIRASVVSRWWAPGPPRPVTGLRAVDLSSMWAGPLAAKILAMAGAEVVKVESRSRPDGARGVPAFYRWLHPGDQCTEVLDFERPDGRERLRSLLETADIVIEASRPRALEQLGVGPGALSPRAGRIWLSVTGYGRDTPGRDWVAFGDDAAVAGGLVGKDPEGDPVFIGDAIADPVTGLFGALAVFQAAEAGGGQLIDLAMSRCAGALVAAG
ncbi:MAG TPA: CoA transferase [Acidimicrobiales bacterium]|nr:CoA transferase [Acidimicrobiales bacterium]